MGSEWLNVSSTIIDGGPMADRSADGDQDDSPSARRDRMQRQAYRIWLNSHLQKIGDDAE